MNYRILLLIIIIFGCKKSPEKQPTLLSDDPVLHQCDSISKIAEIDFKNGVRIYDILGTVEATDFEQFYWKYMKEKYQITIKANDQPSFSEECYSESMNHKIESEYGEDFIEKTMEEAKVEFKKVK